MRQISALFMVALIIGSNAVSFQNKFNGKAQIINDLQGDSQYFGFLEEQSQYVVDEVLRLLKNLLDSSKSDLVSLNNAWKVQKPSLEKVVTQAQTAYKKQSKECTKLVEEQHKLEKEIKDDQDEITDNNKIIKKDKELIKQDKINRCTSNNAYVDHIIDYKDAILLFDILRKAIDGYSQNTDKSFVEIQQFADNVKTLGDYINIFAKDHSEEFNNIMLELRQIGVRTDSHSKNKESDASKKVDINYESNLTNATTGIKGDYNKTEVDYTSRGGDKYVDNTKEKIKLDKLDQDTVNSLQKVKAKLLKVLDDITKVENKKQETMETEESKANEDAINYISKLQDEMRKLTRRNETLVVKITKTKVILAAKVKEVKTCKIVEKKLKESLKTAKKVLKDATNTYESRKSILEGEIALFNKLYVYYKERVYEVATSADKKRVDDYADNKNFNNTSNYTKKSAAKYDNLEGKVNTTISKQAEKNVGSFF